MYTTGTIDLTLNSAAVAGTGTNWLTDAKAQAGDLIVYDKHVLPLAAVDGEGSAALVVAWDEADVVGGSYVLIPAALLPASLAQRISEKIALQVQAYQELNDWMTGEADGGPGGDGKYPLTDLEGTEHLIECPAKMQADMDGGAVNPAWYGAKFDGATDDTAAIQQALDQGGLVELPAGKTALVGKLVPRSNVILQGNGATLLRDTAAIPGTVDAYAAAGSGQYMWETSADVENFHVRDLLFDDKHSASATLHRTSFGIFHKMTRSSFINCGWLDSHRGLMGRNPQEGVVQFDRVRAEKCWSISTVLSAGQSVDSFTHTLELFDLTNAQNCAVEQCFTVGGNGLVLFNADGSWGSNNKRNRATGNIVITPNLTGIYVYGDHSIVQGNQVVDAGKDGIKVNSHESTPSDVATITGNMVEGAGRVAADGGKLIECYAQNAWIDGNTLLLAAPSARAASIQEGVRFYGDNTRFGKNLIRFEGSVEDAMVGIYSAKLFGTTWPSSVTVEGCSIHGVKDGIKLNSAQSDVLVSGCDISAENNGLFSYNLDGDLAVPLRYRVVGNSFIGLGAAAKLCHLRHIDRVALVGNQFSGERLRDVAEGSACAAILGAANVTDGFASAVTVGADGPLFGSAPSLGTWLLGERYTDAAGARHRCTVAGTCGTLNGGATTGSIDAGSDQLTLSSAAGLYVGQFVTVAGVTGVFRVKALDGLVATLDGAADATVAAAAVAFSAPAFVAE